MSEYEGRLLRWTFEQWAVVFTKFKPETIDEKGLKKVRDQWLTAYKYEPDPNPFLGFDKHKNYPVAALVFTTLGIPMMKKHADVKPNDDIRLGKRKEAPKVYSFGNQKITV